MFLLSWHVKTSQQFPNNLDQWYKQNLETIFPFNGINFIKHKIQLNRGEHIIPESPLKSDRLV